MKLTIFCCLSKNEETNKNTIDSLKEMVAYSGSKNWTLRISELYADKSYKKDAVDGLVSVPYEAEIIFATADAKDAAPSVNGISCKVYDAPFQCYQEAYNGMVLLAEGDYFTVINSGDTVSANYVETWAKGIVSSPGSTTYMTRKVFSEEEEEEEEHKSAFRNFRFEPKSKKQLAKFPVADPLYIIDLKSKYDCYPYSFGGNFISTKILKDNKLDLTLPLEAERGLLLRHLAKEMKTVFLTEALYDSYEREERDPALYPGLYELSWYYDSITDFWKPFFAEMEKQYGQVPLFIQYNFMYSILARVNGNMDNKNKHVIPEGEEEAYLEFIADAIKLVDENVMVNSHKVRSNIVGDTMKWIYCMLRYGMDWRFSRYYLGGNIYYGMGDTLFNRVTNLPTTLQFVNYMDGRLEIDGAIHPILHSMADDIYFVYDGKKYDINYCGRFAHTKIFGTAIYKAHPFHLSIPLSKKNISELACMAKFGQEVEPVKLTSPSHFSRVTTAFGSSHWSFGDKKERMAYLFKGVLYIKKVKTKDRFIKELKLYKDMLFKRSESRNFIPFRMLYHICKPFAKRKPIWMYIDKIYKGGDSSEYLYKYAVAKKDGNKHYYLIDKHSADYKRLKREGYKPLVRDSLKHRLMFLYADMMVISNSTVFAFNGYDGVKSPFVRDLHDFHVCCVQHGMSVQKIALAQNRLRDNTRLYFCASEYEIENLSKPVYDYVGYDALKLTGVPRYDGLVDRHEKQIMISPTWRMQAAMPVRTSESEQRDYNPLFKESEYFKVFNSLINDPRLLDAAKEHGYRIKYVLHPIVSSQVDDFDKNEFVDIVPAVGDMSYEDMFCESALMVTDFSGIQFDFAYMRKPLVYLHHKDIPQHYEEGTFHYDTMAFGEICHDNEELIDTLIEYMENDCVMKPEFVARADDFFYYDDHNNCERIYKEMVEYQDKYILKKNK